MAHSLQEGIQLSKIPTISIIDDDESIRNAVESLIAARGFVAVTFASAEAFLQSDDVLRTSCLITDIQLPGMSGLDLQDHLRARGYQVPVIFITAFPEENFRRRAEAGGAVAFLAKPFDSRTLIERITEALGPDSKAPGQIRRP